MGQHASHTNLELNVTNVSDRLVHVLGDCRSYMQAAPKQSFHAVITSCPYWGARDYQMPDDIWGGRSDCMHTWETTYVYNDKITRKAAAEKFSRADGSDVNARALKNARWKRQTVCNSCGAWLGALGMEPFLEQYIANMGEIFAGVWRVLRDDGVVWLNIGDVYNGGGKHQSRDLKRKDLALVPWRLAIHLQQAGWYVRLDQVWRKTNHLRESARDRSSRNHEYFLLFSKKPSYYFNWSPDDFGQSVWDCAPATATFGHVAVGPAEAFARCVRSVIRPHVAETRILDPFAGSGLVPWLAYQYGAVGVGCDRAASSLEQLKQRATAGQPTSVP